MSSRRSAATGGASVGIQLATIEVSSERRDDVATHHGERTVHTMRPLHVYILASHSRVLYVGVTNDLRRRMIEHRLGVNPGFTKQYRTTSLVYFETCEDTRAAIAREKQFKRWPRWRKVRLIEADNPGWRDLSADWSSIAAPSWASRTGE